MNTYADEIVHDPRPLVFTVGSIDGISNIDFKLHSILQQADSESKPIIQFLSLSYDHEFPTKSQSYNSRIAEGRFVSPQNALEGILKSKWLKKHYNDLPSCVMLLEPFNVDIAGSGWLAAENSIVNHYERIFARVSGRDTKIIIVLIRVGHGVATSMDKDAQEDRLSNIRRRCNIDSRCIYLFQSSDFAASSSSSSDDSKQHPLTQSSSSSAAAIGKRLAKTVREFSMNYYHNHGRRLKKWEKMLNPSTQSTLVCRYNFRAGIFYQFIASNDKSFRHFRLAYDTVVGIHAASMSRGASAVTSSLLPSLSWDALSSAVEEFGTTIDLICTGQLTSQLLTSEIEKLSQSMYVTWPNLWWPSQAATSAEWLNLRICQLLLKENKLVEASEQFNGFISRFHVLPTIYPTTIPAGTPEVMWKLVLLFRQWNHAIFMSRHYVTFAELLDTNGAYQSSNDKPSVPLQLLSQVYLYENAAKWAIKRKEIFCDNFGNPALSNDKNVSSTARRLIGMASNLCRLRTVVFEPASFCGTPNQVLISMPGNNERVNLKLQNPYHVVCVCVLKELGQEIISSSSHHESVLRLLEESVTRVSSTPDGNMRRSNRLRWLMAESCIKANQFLLARMYLLPLLGDSSHGGPCEGWIDANSKLSSMLLACDFGLGLSIEYFDTCIRLSCLDGVSVVDRRRYFMSAMLMMLMRKDGEHIVWAVSDQIKTMCTSSSSSPLVGQNSGGPAFLSRGFGKYADSALGSPPISPSSSSLPPSSSSLQLLPRILEINLNLVTNCRGLHSSIVVDGLPDAHVYMAMSKIVKAFSALHFTSDGSNNDWMRNLKCVCGVDGSVSHARLMFSGNEAKDLLCHMSIDGDSKKSNDGGSFEDSLSQLLLGAGNSTQHHDQVEALRTSFSSIHAAANRSIGSSKMVGCASSALSLLLYPYLCKAFNLSEIPFDVKPISQKKTTTSDGNIYAVSACHCLPFLSSSTSIEASSDKPVVMTYVKRPAADETSNIGRPVTLSSAPQHSLTMSRLKQPVSISSSLYASKSIKRLVTSKRDADRGSTVIPSGCSSSFHVLTHQTNAKQGFDVYCWFSHHSWDGLLAKPLMKVGDVVTVTVSLVSRFPSPVHFSRIEFQFSGDCIVAYLDDSEGKGGSSLLQKQNNVLAPDTSDDGHPAVVIDSYSALSSPPVWHAHNYPASKFSCSISPVADLLFYPKQLRIIEFDLAITEELAVLGAHERDYIMSLDRIKFHLNLSQDLTYLPVPSTTGTTGGGRRDVMDVDNLKGPHVVFSVPTNSCQATIVLQMISPAEEDLSLEDGESTSSRRSIQPRMSIVSTPSPLFRAAVTAASPLSPIPYIRIKHAKPLANMTFKRPAANSASNCLMKPNLNSANSRDQQVTELNVIAGVMHRIDLVVESMEDLVLDGEICMSYASSSESSSSVGESKIGGSSTSATSSNVARYNLPVFWWPMCPTTKTPLQVVNSQSCNDWQESECFLTKLSSLEFCPLKVLDFDDRRQRKHHHHHKYLWKRQCASVFRLKKSLPPNSSIIIPLFVKFESMEAGQQIVIQAKLDYVSSREYSKLKVSLLESINVKISKALHLLPETAVLRPGEVSLGTPSFTSLKSIYGKDDRAVPIDSRRLKGVKDLKLDKSLKTNKTLCFSGQKVVCSFNMENISEQQGRVQSIAVHSVVADNCPTPYFQLQSSSDLLSRESCASNSLILSSGDSYRSGYFINVAIPDSEGDKFVSESPGNVVLSWSASCEDAHCKLDYDDFCLRFGADKTLQHLDVHLLQSNSRLEFESKDADVDSISKTISGCGGSDDCFIVLNRQANGGQSRVILFDKPMYGSSYDSRRALIRGDIMWPLVEYPEFSMDYCDDVKLFEDAASVIDTGSRALWVSEQMIPMPIVSATNPAFLVRIQCFHKNRKSHEMNDTGITAVIDQPFNLSIVIFNRVSAVRDQLDMVESILEEEFTVIIQSGFPNFILTGHDSTVVRIAYDASSAFVDFTLFPLVAGLIPLPYIKIIWNRMGLTIAEFGGPSNPARQILCLPSNTIDQSFMI